MCRSVLFSHTVFHQYLLRSRGSFMHPTGEGTEIPKGDPLSPSMSIDQRLSHTSFTKLPSFENSSFSN